MTKTKQFPEWMSKDVIASLYSIGHLMPNEDYHTRCLALAKAAADYLSVNPVIAAGRVDLERDFYTILWNGWIGLASAVLSNFGREKGLPISCNQIVIDDNIVNEDGIADKMAELMLLSKNGAGILVDLDNIRPTGAPISGGGKAIGAPAVAEIVDKIGEYITQNGKFCPSV